MVTFEIDLKGEEGLHSGDVRPLRKVEVDSEPLDGYLCPSCPFPWWALHYPSGRVVHRKGRTLFDPPHGQPKFQDKGSRWLVNQKNVLFLLPGQGIRRGSGHKYSIE